MTLEVDDDVLKTEEPASLRDTLEASYDELSKSPDAASSTGDSAGDAAAASGDKAAPISGDEPTAAAPTESAAVVDPAPASLTGWAKGEWAKLTPEWRAEISKREKESAQAASRYGEDSKFAQTIRAEFEPYRGLMQRFNAAEGPTIRSALASMAVLATGTPEQKLETIKGICQSYGVDLAAVTGGAPTEPMSLLAPVQAELGEVRATLAQLSQAQQEAYREQAENGIQQFLASGKYPHFEVVRVKMGQLMANGHAQTMHDAYEQAVMLVPEARSAYIEAEMEARRQVLAKTATQAKGAAVSQRGSPLPNSMPREEPKSLRGSLEKAWDEASH
jgi:hypothetical protein